MHSVGRYRWLAYALATDNPQSASAVSGKRSTRVSILHCPDAETTIVEVSLDGVGASDGIKCVGAVGILSKPVCVVIPTRRVDDGLAGKLIVVSLDEFAHIDIVSLCQHYLRGSLGVRLCRAVGIGEHIETHTIIALVAIKLYLVRHTLADVIIALAEGYLRAVVTRLGSDEVPLEGAIGTAIGASEEIWVRLTRSERHLSALAIHKCDVVIVRTSHGDVDDLLSLGQLDILQHEAHLSIAVRHILVEWGIERHLVCTLSLGACHLRGHLFATILHIGFKRGQVDAASIRTVDCKVYAVAILCAGGKAVDRYHRIAASLLHLVIVATGSGESHAHEQEE